MVEVRNIIEKLVWMNLDVVLNAQEGACKCERCRADAVAYALNRLKPRYVVTVKGEAIVRAEFLKPQFQLDIITALAEAVGAVSRSPRHDNGNE